MRTPQAALARAKTAAPNWFGLMPKADVAIEPYPAFREKNAIGEYNAPAEDGAAWTLYISAYQAERRADRALNPPRSMKPSRVITFRSRSPDEKPSIPSVAIFSTVASPRVGHVCRAAGRRDEAVFFGGRSNGHVVRAGHAPRGSSSIPGIHTLGWTRQQSIDYMPSHTTRIPTALPAKSIATSSGRDRRPLTCSACSKSARLEPRRRRGSDRGSTSGSRSGARRRQRAR